MLKKRAFLIGASVLTLILVAREIFLHQEVSSLQEEITIQMQSRFRQATEMSRLQDLAAAPAVYDNYLEPVINTSQKMLWPFSRTGIANEWRRRVHTLLDELYFGQSQNLKKEVQAQIDELRTKEEPSILRLKNILATRKKASTDPEFAELVEGELKLMTTANLEKDQKIIAQIKSEGVQKIALLTKKMNQFDHRKLAQYISSGQYYTEIEQPIVDLIVQLKVEDTRRKTWDEFHEAVGKALSKKKAQLQKNAKRTQEISDAKQEADKLNQLFEAVAKSVDGSEGPLEVPAPQGDFPLPTYENPAGLDY